MIRYLFVFLAFSDGAVADQLDFQFQFPASSSFIEDINNAESIKIEAVFLSTNGNKVASRELNLKSGDGFFVGFTRFNEFPSGVDKVCSEWLDPEPNDKWVLFDKCEKIDLSNLSGSDRPIYIDERGIDLFSSFIGQALTSVMDGLAARDTSVADLQGTLDELLDTATLDDFNRPFLISDAYARLITVSLKSNSPLKDPWVYTFSITDSPKASLFAQLVSADAPRKTGSGELTVYSAQVLFEAMLKASPKDLESYVVHRADFIRDFFDTLGFLAKTRAAMVAQLQSNPSIIAHDFATFCKDGGFPEQVLQQCLRSISKISTELFAYVERPLSAAASSRIVTAVKYYEETHARAFSSCSPSNSNQEDILCPFMLRRVVANGICRNNFDCRDQLFPKNR